MGFGKQNSFRVGRILSSSMEELTQNWNRLTLSDREGPGCNLTNEDSYSSYSIVAKFLTKRALNVDVIAKTFNPLWRSRNGFKIQNLGDHIMLFTFDNKSDVDRVLASEPWSFDKHLVVMQRYEHETSFEELSFNRASFWVQLHGIPLRYMTAEAAVKISSVIGEVAQPIDPKELDGGKFLRLKISIDLTLPLCRGRLISLDNGKQTWVSFKYERLPNLCYWCGRLTHDDKDCENWINSEGTLCPEECQFGPTLRAPAFVQSRNTSVTVPGFYTARKKTEATTQNNVKTSPAKHGSDQMPHGGRSDSGKDDPITQGSHVTDCNGKKATINEHGETLPEVPPGFKSAVNWVLNSKVANNKGLNAGTVCDNHHEDLEPDVNNFDVEASTGDNEKVEQGKNPSMPRDSLISNNTRFSEPRDTQEADRVEASHTQYRKLPSWTRRTRPGSSSHGQNSKHISGSKREATPSYREDEPASKRQQYFQDETEELFEVVEAGSQPRQPR